MRSRNIIGPDHFGKTPDSIRPALSPVAPAAGDMHAKALPDDRLQKLPCFLRSTQRGRHSAAWSVQNDYRRRIPADLFTTPSVRKPKLGIPRLLHVCPVQVFDLDGGIVAVESIREIILNWMASGCGRRRHPVRSVRKAVYSGYSRPPCGPLTRCHCASRASYREVIQYPSS